jgi:hypothetical protein
MLFDDIGSSYVGKTHSYIIIILSAVVYEIVMRMKPRLNIICKRSEMSRAYN